MKLRPPAAPLARRKPAARVGAIDEQQVGTGIILGAAVLMFLFAGAFT
jgi:hypothetical protein